MPSRSPYDNVAPIAPKIDTSKIEEILKSQSNEELLKVLIKMVETLSNNSVDVSIPEIKAPSVSVNMDVEKLIKAIPKPEVPVVNVSNEVIEKDEKPPCSYEFEIERDGQGRIKKVLASPTEKLEAYL